MSQPNITCRVCGGTDFTADAGFFFCLECNTQSQDVREEVFDEYFGGTRGTSRVVQKSLSSKSQSGQNKNLTSWEVLNFVLKRITDELVNLGAKPVLKIVTLQLWASYLRKLEIAFTSVEVECKPKLGYVFKNRDAEIVFGVTAKQLKEKSWRSRTRSSSGASSKSSSDIETDTSVSTIGTNLTRRSILRSLAIRKKALASAEYSKTSQEKNKTLSQTLEDLDSSSEATTTPRKIKITKHAKSLLSSSPSSTDDEKSFRKRQSEKEASSVRNVTVAKVVAIVNIALALTQQDIQVSDFLRWIKEGHIFLGTSKTFLPEGIKLNSDLQRIIKMDHLSYVNCQKLIVGMCSELDIELPPPNLSQLAERYCLELQLPVEMTDIVKRLLFLSTHSNGRLSNTVCHMSKYPEVQVMSAIIIVFKLLFSLDDCTEYRLSHTATEINRARRKEGEEEQLFVFSEWVQFIECRKAVLSSCDLPTRSAVYGDAMGRDAELFIQHNQHTGQLPNIRETIKRYALDQEWVAAMVRCLRMLGGDEVRATGVQLPASLTPLHSGTQLLLSQYADRVAPVTALLQQHFPSHTLDHVLRPDRTIALGMANDLNIVQRDLPAADFHFDPTLSAREGSSRVIPRFRINQVNITVNVVRKVDSAIRKRTRKTTNQTETPSKEKYLRDLDDIISDDSEEEEDAESGFCEKSADDATPNFNPDTLELFNPGARYWFCLSKIDRKNVSINEFELFAMKTFSSSFFWLLKECSRMICVPMVDLYANIVSIETKNKYILKEAQYLVKMGGQMD